MKRIPARIPESTNHSNILPQSHIFLYLEKGGGRGRGENQTWYRVQRVKKKKKKKTSKNNIFFFLFSNTYTSSPT